MKTHLYRPILLAGGILLLAVAGSGQTVTAKVPFGFQITNSEMPPGEYSVSQLHSGSPVVRFNNQDAHKSVMVLGRPLDPSSDKRPRLVFHCVESRCSLAEIWGATAAAGVRLSEPRVTVQEADRVAVIYMVPKKAGK
jgi:hypothetical protein